MSKTTLVLLIFFFFGLGSLVFLYYNYSDNYASLLTKKNQVNQSPHQQSSLSFSPGSLPIVAGRSESVAIMLTTEGDAPTLAQLEIGYDPAVLENVQILPGSFFTNPTVLLNAINQRTGRISYAVQASTSQANNKKADTLVTLLFTTKGYIATSETTLSFLGKTTIHGKGNENILKTTSEAKLFVATPSAY